MLRLIVAAPVVNNYAKKTKMWHFYSKHRAIDIAAWTLFGFGVAFEITNNLLFHIVESLAGPGMDYYNAANLIIAISSLLLGGFTSTASLILFAAKARICYNMTRAAEKYNQSHGVAEAESDNRRRVAFMPSIALTL